MPRSAVGEWRIRAVVPDDASRLADMAVQLGYPVAADQVPGRLSGLAGDPSVALLVAVDAGDDAIGWLHVELKHSLLSPLAAQVMGLVVDRAWRSGGVGAALLERAEAWAAERGCHEMLVATRVTRERAHDFYRRGGYRLLKTSHIFSKPLA